MRTLFVLSSVFFLVTHSLPHQSTKITKLESEARSFLLSLDSQLSEKCFESSIAEWNYATDINEQNLNTKLQLSLEMAKFGKEVSRNLTEKYDWESFQDDDLLRMYKKLSILGTAALPEDKLQEYTQLSSEMSQIYSTTKICSYEVADRCNLALEPDLTKIMRESRNEEELRHVWTQWHDKAGKPIKDKYKRFIELDNEAASLNGFADGGEYWLKDYESETFKKDVEELWLTLKPLYEQLHAYVRGKLRNVYGDQFNTSDGLIPAHLLGNMWAQSWSNIYSLVVPYPQKASVDVTEQMKQQGFDAKKMFQTSDEFFTSLGLLPLMDSFWANSMIEKPKGREVVCHASAWDLCTGNDFRIKQCTEVTTHDLVVVHHEMGHTQYQMQYKDLPLVYREGANPGFHEAIGDALALSVQTPKHLKEINLLDEKTPIDDYETTINFLMNMALDKIVNLPWTYLVDKYRWDIFDGSVKSSQYNQHWWKLRKEYQGVKPPADRQDDAFDAGAKYHVPAHVEYVRYFVSNVIQFQFHRALCIEADQYETKDPSKPLHNCDIYKSKKAGSRFAAGLAMGSSRPWPEVMKAITGQEKMDASALQEYFSPLEKWLTAKNLELGETIGWKN